MLTLSESVSLKLLSKPRHPLAFTLFLAASSALGAAEIMQAPETAPLDAFKQFLASPPIIESLVWKKVMPSEQVNRPQPAPTTSRPLEHEYWFQGRWQPGFLILKSGHTLEVTQPGRQAGDEINARLGDDFWTWELSGFIMHWQERTHALWDMRMQPSKLFQTHTREFREVMSMGVMHLDIGAIRWNGDNFLAEGYVPEISSAVRAHGIVKPDSNGYAQEMAVEYFIRTNAYHYVVHYKYDTNIGLPFLPSVIQSFWVNEGKEVKMAEYALRSLKTSTVALPSSLFDPQANLRTNSSPVLVYKDGAWYQTNALGKLAHFTPPFANERSPTTGEKLEANQLYFGAVFLNSFTAFSVIRRINKQNKQNTKRKKTT